MAARRTLAARLNTVTVHAARALRRDAAASDLAAEHRTALGMVYFAGPLRMGTLAAAEHVSAAAMTRTVGILERAGLVHGTPDPEDERATLIRVTPKGARMVARGVDNRVRRLERALDKLTPHARTRVTAALADLERLVALLERERPSPRQPRS